MRGLKRQCPAGWGAWRPHLGGFLAHLVGRELVLLTRFAGPTQTGGCWTKPTGTTTKRARGTLGIMLVKMDSFGTKTESKHYLGFTHGSSDPSRMGGRTCRTPGYMEKKRMFGILRFFPHASFRDILEFGSLHTPRRRVYTGGWNASGASIPGKRQPSTAQQVLSSQHDCSGGEGEGTIDNWRLTGDFSPLHQQPRVSVARVFYLLVLVSNISSSPPSSVPSHTRPNSSRCSKYCSNPIEQDLV